MHRRSWHIPRYATQDHLSQSARETDSLSPSQGCPSPLCSCAHRTGGLFPHPSWRRSLRTHWILDMKQTRTIRASSAAQTERLISAPWWNQIKSTKNIRFSNQKGKPFEQARCLLQTANWLVSVKNIEPMGIRKL